MLTSPAHDCHYRLEAHSSGVRTFADITSRCANAVQQEPQIDSSSRVTPSPSWRLLLLCLESCYMHTVTLQNNLFDTLTEFDVVLCCLRCGCLVLLTD